MEQKELGKDGLRVLLFPLIMRPSSSLSLVLIFNFIDWGFFLIDFFESKWGSYGNFVSCLFHLTGISPPPLLISGS